MERRGYGEGRGKNIYLTLHCHHQNDSCINMGSDESHLNVSLIVRDKVTSQCPQTTTFEEKGEPKQIWTKVPLLTSLTAYRLAKPAHWNFVPQCLVKGWAVYVTGLCHLVCPGLLMGCLFDCLSFWPQVCVLQCPLQSIWAAFPWGFTAAWVFLAAGCCAPCWLGSLLWMFDDGV